MHCYSMPRHAAIPPSSVQTSTLSLPSVPITSVYPKSRCYPFQNPISNLRNPVILFEIPLLIVLCNPIHLLVIGRRNDENDERALSEWILTRVVLVHVGSVVVLTTGETTTTWVLAVLADTTVTGGDVSSVLSGLGKVGRHLLCSETKVDAKGRE